MQAVGIVGVGLIGGSFGLALRKAGFAGPILGVSSARSIDQALERGAIDRGATLEEAAGVCDVLFLSQPIFGILETLRKLDPLVRPDTLVTDAGSTKRRLWRRRGAACDAAHFWVDIPWRARRTARGGGGGCGSVSRAALGSDFGYRSSVSKMGSCVRGARDRSRCRAARSAGGVEFASAAVGFDGAGFGDRRSRSRMRQRWPGRVCSIRRGWR